VTDGHSRIIFTGKHEVGIASACSSRGENNQTKNWNRKLGREIERRSYCLTNGRKRGDKKKERTKRRHIASEEREEEEEEEEGGIG
jgi:hypothetical protein